MEAEAPLFGLRSYTLQRNVKLGTCVLVGRFGTLWPENRQTAECKVDLKNSIWLAREHLLKDRCKCGIYALTDSKVLQVQYSSLIYATVVGWGAYILGEQGWRAEHVQIDSLWINNSCLDVTPAPGMAYDYTVCLKPSKYLFYLGENLADYLTPICEEHFTKFVLAKHTRAKLSGFPLSDLMENLYIRYPSTTIKIGVPWSVS